jgi:TonB family protein
MDGYSSSLSKALFFSMALHTGILGGALAFAHYGTGLFSSDLRYIDVTLVAEGKGNGQTGGRNAAAAHPVSLQRAALPVQEPVLPQHDGTDGHQEHSADVPRSDSEGNRGAEAALAGATAGGTDQTGGERGGSADGSSGSGAVGMNSEQWQRLHSALEKAKTYPRLARERGIEGSVLVRFKVLPSGNVETVNIVRSSGVEILDEASVRTVYRAAPMPYVSGWVEVPMSYVLK